MPANAKNQTQSHTPGPWRYEATGCVFSATLLIAECPMNKPQTVPDARLIAAAPELLAAIKAIVGYAHSRAEDLYGTPGWAKADAAIVDAYAAITRATGVAP